MSMRDFKKERERMVRSQLAARGIKDAKVLDTMKKVPRHLFVPESMLSLSYSDEPLPIGEGQTISQPYIVAYMTEVLALQGGERVLEIGTGSGYQTAILAEIAQQVFTVELVGALSHRAQEALKRLKYTNILFKIGDGTFGWEEQAPFDAIMVTAAPDEVPKSLKEQLKIGGRMIIPVGTAIQELVFVTRGKNKFKRKKLLPVRFVPLVTTH
ncbi:MAG: protein-L-isoaspartate(D-aspartate) O-methyltransferase [Candidatus Aminicenantes bacterium]|nr:MAG: protein-L-isoaspartate(D-aspartate) O-methyltransferase [Candidatus Aminicenantes bacterium]